MTKNWTNRLGSAARLRISSALQVLGKIRGLIFWCPLRDVNGYSLRGKEIDWTRGRHPSCFLLQPHGLNVHKLADPMKRQFTSVAGVLDATEWNAGI